MRTYVCYAKKKRGKKKKGKERYGLFGANLHFSLQINEIHISIYIYVYIYASVLVFL